MKVLVISPHPDDETLGAGGTLLRLKAEGHSIYWLNITTVEGCDGYSEHYIEKRREQLKRVSERYGFVEAVSIDFPTTMLDTISDSVAISRISEVVKNFEPDVLILPNKNDVHSDHKKVYEWGIACSKCFRFPSIKAILTMEIVSETDFGEGFFPNFFVDITDYIEEKISIMNIYESEVQEPPFPRSTENIKALAQYRGAASGNRYAEAFKIVKVIW